MVSALVCSGQLSLPAWEPYVPSRAQKTQSTERRWQRFVSNTGFSKGAVSAVGHGRLERVAISSLYLALDTTVLWERYCMIQLSVVCCGRAVPAVARVRA